MPIDVVGRRDRRTTRCRPTTTCSRWRRPRSPRPRRPDSSSWSRRAPASTRCCAVRFRCSKSCATRAGAPTGLSILSKRIGPSTALLYDAAPRPAHGRASDRSAGRSRSSIRRPRPGWSPAASAWRRSPRSPHRCARAACRSTLFYGARRAGELFYLDFFRDLDVELVLTTEDGSAGERGRVVAPLERRLAARRADAPVMMYACGPEGMLAATARIADALRPAVPGVGRAHHGMRPRRLLQLRRADARRRRPVPSRAIVPGRTGAAGGSDTVGLEALTTEDTMDTERVRSQSL